MDRRRRDFLKACAALPLLPILPSPPGLAAIPAPPPAPVPPASPCTCSPFPTMQMPMTLTLTITGEPGVNVTLHWDGKSWASGITDGDGLVVFPGVPTGGRLDIVCSAPGRGSASGTLRRR